jgi:hypothetical protein
VCSSIYPLASFVFLAGNPMVGLVKLIKMFLTETYSKVHLGTHLSDNFPIQNGLKEGDALSPQL